MRKKNYFANQLQIKKSLRTEIYEFLKKEIKEEGIKKNQMKSYQIYLIRSLIKKFLEKLLQNIEMS